MIVSVYLSSELHQILCCYGSLDDVVNKILDAGTQGLIDIMQKPSAPEKRGGAYYHINVRNQDYVTLMETYGPKSSRISLRRLLYWFVENEVYEELGWEANEEYVDKRENQKHQAIIELKQALFKARTIIPEHRGEIDEFRNLINEIEEKLWYAK